MPAHSTRRTLLTLSLLLPLGLGPAGATLPGPIDALEAARDGVRPMRDAVRTIRKSFDGTILGAVRATAEAASRPGPTAGLVPPSVPSTLEDAVASVAGAVGRARLHLRLDTPDLDLTEAQAWKIVHDSLQNGEVPVGIPEEDPGPALRAAARVAMAIDSALPALRAAARKTPSKDAEECDLSGDQNICVSGTGDTTYTRDHLLVIDLGGNDTYRSTAASASGGPRIVLDLAGDDLYQPDIYVAGQAFATLGGLAMLADLGGDDTYAVTSESQSVVGQGSGVFGGVGILVDAQGDDTYTLSATATGLEANATGQGTGVFGGVGALLDGGGDDIYATEATSLPTSGSDLAGDTATLLSDANASGQGIGGAFGGAGLFLDSGGEDVLSIRSTVGSVPATDPMVWDPEASDAGEDFIPQGQSTGQGWGTGGNGYLIQGPGPTTYEMVTTAGPYPGAESGGGAGAQGQGAGSTGQGVLSDAGGDDTYRVGLSLTSEVSVRAEDGCGCAGVVPRVRSGNLVAWVQGYSVLGNALLDDAAGDDAYLLEGSAVSRMGIRDDRTEPATTPLVGEVGTSVSDIWGQGLGSTSIGAIWDGGGNDTYTADVSVLAEADTSAQVPENTPWATFDTRMLKVWVQGAAWARSVTVNGADQAGHGLGALVDLGGSDDYTARVAFSARVNDGEALEGPTLFRALGDVYLPTPAPATGLAFDLDGTGSDTYTVSPAIPTCEGERGSMVWRDCEPIGIGYNG